MLENIPSKNPFGFVVVKPTLIFSLKVDRKEPIKSYFIMELCLKLTPISSAQIGPLKEVQRQSQE